MTDEATTVAAEAAVTEAAPVELSAPLVDRASETTPRSAIERAFVEVDKADVGDVPVDPVKSEGQERGPDGKFVAKDTSKVEGAKDEATEPGEDAAKPLTNFTEPPKRFSADAKAVWGGAPEPVRAEITRAITELEKGIEQYRADFEPFREFDQKLKASGQDFKTVVSHYIGIESMLAQNPLKGLDTICQNMGMSLRDVAAHVMGQTPDQSASAQDATIRELRQEIAALKEGLGGVSNTIRTQSEQSVLAQIAEFSADKPRFEELSNDIAFFLQNGRANDLQEAYELAERLNPAPQTTAPAAAAPAAQPAAPAQPRKGNLSLSGAPSSGSNPANRKPPSSARDALDNAFAKVGM